MLFFKNCDIIFIEKEKEIKQMVSILCVIACMLCVTLGTLYIRDGEYAWGAFEYFLALLNLIVLCL